MRRLAFLLVLLTAAPASAAIENYTITLDVAQATTALPGATGSGTGTATLDTGTNLFSWNISFSGTTGTETLAHFHKGAVGIPGGVVHGLPVGSPKVGSSTVTGAEATDINAGLWYVNIHTSHSPGGEIRGQVLLAPTTVPALSWWGLVMLTALLGITAGLWWRRSSIPATGFTT